VAHRPTLFFSGQPIAYVFPSRAGVGSAFFLPGPSTNFFPAARGVLVCKILPPSSDQTWQRQQTVSPQPARCCGRERRDFFGLIGLGSLPKDGVCHRRSCFYVILHTLGRKVLFLLCESTPLPGTSIYSVHSFLFPMMPGVVSLSKLPDWCFSFTFRSTEELCFSPSPKTFSFPYFDHFSHASFPFFSPGAGRPNVLFSAKLTRLLLPSSLVFCRTRQNLFPPEGKLPPPSQDSPPFANRLVSLVRKFSSRPSKCLYRRPLNEFLRT